MDASAIKAIQESALANVSVNDTDHPVIILPKDMEVKSLEPHMGNPYYFRGEFSTSVKSEFTEYVCAQDKALCFVNVKNMSAKAYFDLGTPDEPGHGHHRASLSLIQTAPYAALLQINGDRKNQQELAEWLEDWRSFLVGLNQDDESIDIKKAIAGVRSITVAAKSEATHEENNLSKNRSSMEEIEAKSKADIPVGFKFTCTPYEELGQREFTLRLSVILDRFEKPQLVLRIIRLEAIEEEMAVEFKDSLTGAFNDSVKTHIGTFAKVNR